MRRVPNNSTVQEVNEEFECGEHFVERDSTSLRKSTELSAQRLLYANQVCIHCTVDTGTLSC